MDIYNIQTIIEEGVSKRTLNYLVAETKKDQKLFNWLWKFGKDESYKQNWRCLWIIDNVTEKDNAPLKPILDEIYQLLIFTENESLVRFALKFILRFDLIEEYIPTLLDKSTAWMCNPKAKISSQVLGLEYFRRVCILYPEMKPELHATIEDQLERSPSAGYKNRLLRVKKEFF